jgi:hypothetical protein
MTDVSHTPVETKITAPKIGSGFRGRKIIAGLSTAGSIFATATASLFMDRATMAEWHQAMLWLVIPTVLITLGFISAEKVLARKA